jgi:hypothetical protein
MSLAYRKTNEKIIAIPEHRLGELENIFPWGGDYSRLLIKHKGKVVARAEWDKRGQLVVISVRRPKKTTLKVGDILIDRGSTYAPIPIPETYPELETNGILLFRTSNYDSRQAVRPDPFWEKYEGWTILPKTINGRDGLAEFFQTYPELRTQPHTEFDPSGADKSGWMMARQKDVDDYVCGKTDTPPELIPYQEPPQRDYISQRPVLGPTDNFEFFSLYWENTWIIYIPRTTSPEAKEEE